MNHNILLYGVYGYTGKLILDELLKLNSGPPLLAGRSKVKLAQLANEYQLDYEVFSVDETSLMLRKHKNVSIFINAAGPFAETAMNIAKTCVQNGVHYLDITGEIEVFQQLQTLNQAAVNAGVMVLPGAGFDVVPTDCLANKLKRMLPDASHLEMAFATKGGALSRGTAKTSVRAMGQGSSERRNGKLESLKWVGQEKEINFGPFTATCLPIPWGDLETAWVSTKIPNIKVYTPFRKQTRKNLGLISRIIKLPIVKKAALFFIEKRMYGPSKNQRNSAQAHIIGRVWNAAGAEKKAHLVTPDGYTLTAYCVAEIAKRILKGEMRSGFQTPAMAYGFEFIESILGVAYLSREEN